MSGPALDGFLETAHLLADAAGEIARAHWFAASETGLKPDGSALTEADTQVEARLREIIADRHPGHGIHGEEYGATDLEEEFVWVLDPIDGTRQFAARLMNFGVLIALCHEGRPVLGIIDQPLARARFAAAGGHGATLNGAAITASDTRALSQATVAIANPASFPEEMREPADAIAEAARLTVYDGGCLAYGALARGQVDLCLNGPDLDPYDICALVPIVTQAGGTITDWENRPLTLASEGAILAAATPALHAQAVDRLTRHDPVWIP
ncbi:inositol monophosphatase family protein [Roseovarius sp.]|uniref:inositol monophosphatase family protein n=1 Tax=Roseovarius sp. TaxID=1486281 RepID=UPI003BA9316F